MHWYYLFCYGFVCIYVWICFVLLRILVWWPPKFCNEVPSSLYLRICRLSQRPSYKNKHRKYDRKHSWHDFRVTRKSTLKMSMANEPMATERNACKDMSRRAYNIIYRSYSIRRMRIRRGHRSQGVFIRLWIRRDPVLKACFWVAVFGSPENKQDFPFCRFFGWRPLDPKTRKPLDPKTPLFQKNHAGCK